MPNRILRDCTDSEKINLLDVYEERFFYRLIMVVDDYGRFYAHAGLLKAKMFPFLLDKIREADISRWLVNCQAAGLITLYEIAGKHYLQIEEFKQRLDKAKEKYPPPIGGSSITTDNDFPPETNPKQKPETETESETKFARENFSVGLDFFKIANEVFKLKPSEVAEQFHPARLGNTISANLRGISKEKLFEKFDSEYVNYEFEDVNHFFNALKKVGKEILNIKPNGQTTFKKNGASHSDAELAEAVRQRFNLE